MLELYQAWAPTAMWGAWVFDLSETYGGGLLSDCLPNYSVLWADYPNASSVTRGVISMLSVCDTISYHCNISRAALSYVIC